MVLLFLCSGGFGISFSVEISELYGFSILFSASSSIGSWVIGVTRVVLSITG